MLCSGPDMAPLVESEEDRQQLEAELQALEQSHRVLQDQVADLKGDKKQAERNNQGLKQENKVREIVV